MKYTIMPMTLSADFVYCICNRTQCNGVVINCPSYLGKFLNYDTERRAACLQQLSFLSEFIPEVLATP